MRENESPGQHSWYAGLPVREERSISAAEIELLETFRRNCWIRGWAALGSIPLLLIAFVSLSAVAWVALASGANQEVASAVTLIIATLFLFALPLLLLLARDSFRRRKLLRSDLEVSSIVTCQGSPDQLRLPSRVTRKLSSRGLLPLEAGNEVSMEIMRSSGRLWRFNEVLVREWITVRRAVTAETPEFAAVAANWVKPVETEDGDVVHLHRRALSEGERLELQSYVPRLTPGAIALILLLNALAIAEGYEAFRERSAVPVGMLLIGSLAAFHDIRLWRALKTGKKLRYDLTEGWVVIARSRGFQVAPGELEPPVEYLPVSGVEWTSGGTPSLWRRVRV